MDRTLVDFIKALRTAEVKVSPAETLDAMHAIDLVGFSDRQFLKDSLSIVLSKNTEEKAAFNTCFDRFFTVEKFDSPLDDGSLDDSSQDPMDDGEFDPSEQQSGEQGQGGSGGGSGGGMGEGAGEEDTSEDTSLQPQSALGQLLLSGDKNELAISIAEAGRAVEVNQIVVFTQKGLYTRKIMDHMGLRELQDEIGELQGLGGNAQNNLAGRLKKARDLLRERVRDYVERQYFLHADETGKQLREE